MTRSAVPILSAGDELNAAINQQEDSTAIINETTVPDYVIRRLMLKNQYNA